MPGLHTIISNQPFKTLFQESDFYYLLHEENFKVKIITNSPNCVITISFYNGYPFIEWQNGDIQIVLEGMIYNYSLPEIQKNLNKIAENFVKNVEYKNLIEKFVNSADGDYIVQIWESKSRKFLVFNDYFGRLPLYYYYKNDSFICSRELKTILKFISKIEVNPIGLAEFLMQARELGNKTIFKDIFFLLPAQMIVLKPQNKYMSFEISNSTDFNFILKNPFLNKKESIDFLKKLFFESIENRVITLEKNGYQIISDLSGGYDTRTVLGGLSKFSNNVLYFTMKYIRDESYPAQCIFQKIGSPGKYYHLNFDNTFDFSFKEIGPLIYKTDGLVNYYTTFIGYKDVQYYKNYAPEKSAYFSGFGASDFMRKRPWVYHHSLFYGFKRGFYSNLPLKLACKIVKLKPIILEDELINYLNSYPERTPFDQLKRFYYEYFNRYVNAGGEERGRLHFWSVQPLWGLNFTRAILSGLPRKWVGFKYYIQFMKNIDPRLLEVPIFRSNINLMSHLSINWYETKDKIIKSNLLKIIKNEIKRKMPFFPQWYFQKKARTKMINKEYLFEKLYFYYNTLVSAKEVFDFNIIKKNKNLIPQDNLDCILTVLIYFNEIEQRFGNKFST